MDTSTLDLYQILQVGPYDEAALNRVKRLIAGQRHALRTRNDLSGLEQLITNLEDWAAAAGGGWLGASALAEAADIAEADLRNVARAEQLRSQAIVAGRPLSARPESAASEGAIDANAELLHELKTLPPGALTQTLLTEELPEEATEELDVESLRESSIPRPQVVPAAPSLRTDSEARRPSTLHGYIAPQHEDSSRASGRGEQDSATQRGETSLQMAARVLDRRSSPPAAQGGAELQGSPFAGVRSPDRRTSPFAAQGGTELESDLRSPTAAQGGDRASQVEARVFLTAPAAEREAHAARAPEMLSPFASVTTERESHVDARPSDRRSTPVPTLLSDTTAASDFPAQLRSTPPPALRAVTEPRRSSSVPAQPRAAGGGAAAASQALRPAMQTQPIRLTPLPQLSVSEQAESAPEEHTQEVHTIDLELHPTLSVPPLSAADAAAEYALSAEITQAEQVLESDASPDRVRELAELYVKRDGHGDRKQAADLFCTLGEVLGNPGGVAMLERALALVPDHAEAKALLTRYAVRPRKISSPKITVLGMQPKLAVQAPPPAAAIGVPPPAAGTAAALAPPAAAGAAQPMDSVPAAAARATVPGTGPMNDVLSLHGVPQVVTTRPSVPPISSLTPIVRSDASELQARRLSVAKNSYIALGGIALSAAAALGIYLSVRAPSNHNAPPNFARESTATASQPTAPEAPATAAAAAVEAAAAEAEQAGKPTPLAPPAPSHLPLLKLESAQLRGGKLSETQLTAALGKAQPKLLACYEQAIEKKPRIKGRVIYGFTVRTNGRATNIKRVGGTLKDDTLQQCSAKVLETVRFPKPRKSSQVKLPIQYKRT